MKEITIREMRPDETPLFITWLYANRGTNKFDPEPFRKNQVKIYVAENETGILNFFPVHLVFLFGANSPKPDMAPITQTRCILAFKNFMIEKCKELNISDMYVQPSDVHYADVLSKMGCEVAPQTLRFNVNKTKTEPR
jgi:hypothetical protein